MKHIYLVETWFWAPDGPIELEGAYGSLEDARKHPAYYSDSNVAYQIVKIPFGRSIDEDSEAKQLPFPGHRQPKVGVDF